MFGSIALEDRETAEELAAIHYDGWHNTAPVPECPSCQDDAEQAAWEDEQDRRFEAEVGISRLALLAYAPRH